MLFRVINYIYNKHKYKLTLHISAVTNATILLHFVSVTNIIAHNSY